MLDRNDNDKAYRILREGDDTALATTIKNERMINSLTEKYEEYLDNFVSETLWEVME